MATRLEKKMIVGRAWKASMNPRESFLPGTDARGPNTNSAPAEDFDSIKITRLLMASNRLIPAGITNINKANKSWRQMLQRIRWKLGLTRFLNIKRDMAQAIASRIKIPEKLIRLYASIVMISQGALRPDHYIIECCPLISFFLSKISLMTISGKRKKKELFILSWKVPCCVF